MGYGWVEILGLVSGLIGLSVSIPQLVKVLKANSHVGVSITAWFLMMLNYASWLGFSIRKDSPSQLLTNAIAVIITGVLVYVLLNEQLKQVIKPVFIVVLSSIATIVLIVLLPEIFMNVLLSLFILARTPQLASSWKSWRTGRHTNVSILTYILMMCSSLGWATYGLIAGLWMNVFSASMGLLISFTIVLLELAAERKHRRNITEPV